jgi:3-methyl-2-oxobutanoate hydroxymethyltransferase
MNDAAPAASESGPDRVTLRTLSRMAQTGEVFACLTCYDATMARLLERAGVHVLLVGDTAAEVVLGFDKTIHMPLDVSVALTAGVKRGAAHTVVMADMPFLSYHTGVGEAVRNAGRYLTEGLADVVKIEADASMAPVVGAMAAAGIPVCAHVGSRPQRATLTGGYTAAGRTAEEARRIIEDARALEGAGAVLLLVEAVPNEVTRGILDATRAPLIGIGAGPACHGQVLVVQDLLGMTDTPPRFAEAVGRVGDSIVEAGREWVRRVASREVGGQRYSMREGEAGRLAEGLRASGGPGVR